MPFTKITIQAAVLADRNKAWVHYTEPKHITQWNLLLRTGAALLLAMTWYLEESFHGGWKRRMEVLVLTLKENLPRSFHSKNSSMCSWINERPKSRLVICLKEP